MRTHGEAVAQDFGVEFHEAASTFRTFLHEDVLTRKVAESGDGWWHGFQHGMGILGHAAPLAWVLGKNIVYIASSNTAETRAGVTCASDPTIDNYVRYCGVRVHHDGFEFSRQDKVRNIVQYSQSSQIPISLRVCWESEGGQTAVLARSAPERFSRSWRRAATRASSASTSMIANSTGLCIVSTTLL